MTLRWNSYQCANERIELSSVGEATSMAMRMLGSVSFGSDQEWAASLLAVDALAALLYVGSPCGNGLGMEWVQSVCESLCDAQLDVTAAIRKAVAGARTSPAAG
jgi:hypothetical protein